MFKEEKKEKVQKTKSRQEAWRASSKKSKGQSQDLQTIVTDLQVWIDMRFCRSTFHPEDSSKSNLDVLKSHNLKKLQKRSSKI